MVDGPGGKPFTPQPGDEWALRFAALECPDCGGKLDATTGVAGSSGAPEDGSFSICGYCASVSAYTVSPLGVVGMRSLTAAELEAFQSDPELLHLQRMLRARSERRRRAGGA